MLQISDQVDIPESEIEMTAVRARGPGGQNVNKTATAVQLRFDIRASSLPDIYKERLLALRDRRISRDGIVVIKAQRRRTQEGNRTDALERLRVLIGKAMATRRPRKRTRPPPGARRKRLERKTRRGHIKALRGKVPTE